MELFTNLRVKLHSLACQPSMPKKTLLWTNQSISHKETHLTRGQQKCRAHNAMYILIIYGLFLLTDSQDLI